MGMKLPTPKTGLAPTNGIELYYEDYGDPSHPTVVMIMGLAAQLVYWPDPFVARILERGFRVVRFDNRDIGLSTKIKSREYDPLPAAWLKLQARRRIRAPYTLFDMVEDTAGLLDHLQIPAAHVVGASMGGMIAQIFAALYRERTLSLTSVMSSTLHPSLPGPRLDVMARIGLMGRRGQGGREDYVRQTVAVYRAIHGKGYPFPPDAVAERAGRAYDRCFHPRGAERQGTAILATGSFEPLLGRVKSPALVIHGDIDPLVSVKGGKASARAIAGARLEILPGMGHFLHEQHWDQFADWIAAMRR
jgi:pimeloyl-ACP methyl ester carboxylesterase